jgi:multimeric flavodoxin WrbA
MGSEQAPDDPATVRKGQAAPPLQRQAFAERWRERFADPAFDAHHEALDALEGVAFDAYQQGRKAPRRTPAGPGFDDPGYELSDEWRRARDRILAAQHRQSDRSSPDRALLICASPRNDGTCPGEVSKTWRLCGELRAVLEQEKVEVTLLDLSRITSDPQRHIHPCKGCVSTAMPLCHWPCSCYPNPALGQTNDWMNEIYEMWAEAHGVCIVTPVHWYGPPTVLKAMIDRLVCADGGNPDPTRTAGKDAAKAKALELAGWDYPQHLAGRAYGVVVHGDVEGAEGTRRALSDWLDWMGLVECGQLSRLQRYIGYWQPYATSHSALDAAEAFQEEARNVARALVVAMRALRDGTPLRSDARLKRPRPK